MAINCRCTVYNIPNTRSNVSAYYYIFKKFKSENFKIWSKAALEAGKSIYFVLKDA